MCTSSFQKVLDLQKSEFTHAQLISALKKCGRGIDARSAIHHFRTQKRVAPVCHHLYRKIRASINPKP